MLGAGGVLVVIKGNVHYKGWAEGHAHSGHKGKGEGHVVGY